MQPKRQSGAHAVLVNIISAGNFSEANIVYKGLSDEDQAEMKALHKEWFPIDYPQEFFDRMRNNNVIAIGCFYKIKIPEQEDGTSVSEELILIGAIFSKIERENDRNEVMIEFMDEPRWNIQSWFERAREFFSCGTTLPSRRTACYIMTIGVIDECR